MSEINNQTETTGRKIFFLYPTASVQNQIINDLAQQEYEAYAVKNYSRLARVLKKYPNSVVFVNIDEALSEPNWEKWITDLSKDIPDIKIGVFSSNTDEKIREKYEKDLNLACGFTFLKVDMSKTTGAILEILNGINAKGRRKYLRASTDREANATVNIPYKDGYINGVINDVSVVGISCVLDRDPGYAKNELIKNIQIKLQAMLSKVEAVVFGSRISNGKKVYVLLFTQRIDPNVRTKIRKYIQQNLQQKMDTEIG